MPTILVSSFFLFVAFCNEGVAAGGRTTTTSAVIGSPVLKRSYAVIFDAGSSGSRVHVFCFGDGLDLLPIGDDELEFFEQTKPGLSSYAGNPEEAANSLVPLLEKAESVVPQDLRGKTPLRVGATAGLRLVGSETSEKILQAVRNLLQHKSSLNYKAEWVTVLDGTQEGSYMWIGVNFLLRNTGKPYPETVGVIDLGGGSLQMAYAIPRSSAASAPTINNGTNYYVKELSLKGTKYYLYVHSYLNYGLLAARAEILKNRDGSGCFCVLKGFNGTYEYGEDIFNASSPPSGSSFYRCRRAVVNALKVDAPCEHEKCTFGGVWNGGGGEGQNNLYLASFFYDKPAQIGLINASATAAVVEPSYLEKAAKRACKLSLEDAKSGYPNLYDPPYVCMDLVYLYSLLVDGFGLKPWQKVTLVTQVPYGKFTAEAAWPLGSAIEVVSSAAPASA